MMKSKSSKERRFADTPPATHSRERRFRLSSFVAEAVLSKRVILEQVSHPRHS